MPEPIWADRMVPRDRPAGGLAKVPPPPTASPVDVTAYYFHGEVGFEYDRELRALMAAHGGEPIGAGTFTPTQERDIQYRFPSKVEAEAVAVELRSAGFRVVMRGLP